jgi:hypothetical protein
MRGIGTHSGLYPKQGHSWEYVVYRHPLLNSSQKAAIARFLVALPKLVEFDIEDQREFRAPYGIMGANICLRMRGTNFAPELKP